MEPVKISVVIPSFNQGRFLHGLMCFLRKKRHFIYEIILLDGGSTDCTLDVIDSNKDIITFSRSFSDKGQAAAVNEGIQRATGNIIVWVNSDDMLCEDAFEIIEDHFSRQNAEELLVGSSLCISENADIIRFYPVIKDLRMKWWMYGVSLFGQTSVVFKKSVWTELGGLNERLRYSLDYDFFCRVFKCNKSIKLIDKPLGVMRFYEGIKSFSPDVGPEMYETSIRNFGLMMGLNKFTHFQRFGFNVFRIFGFYAVMGYILKRFNVSGFKMVPGIYAGKILRGQCPLEAKKII